MTSSATRAMVNASSKSDLTTEIRVIYTIRQLVQEHLRGNQTLKEKKTSSLFTIDKSKTNFEC